MRSPLDSPPGLPSAGAQKGGEGLLSSPCCPCPGHLEGPFREKLSLAGAGRGTESPPPPCTPCTGCLGTFLLGYVTPTLEREDRPDAAAQHPAPSPAKRCRGSCGQQGERWLLEVLPAEQMIKSLVWLNKNLSMNETCRYVCLNL